MVERFVEAIEQVLHIKCTKISLEEEWSRSGPEDIRTMTLEQFLDKVRLSRINARENIPGYSKV